MTRKAHLPSPSLSEKQGSEKPRVLYGLLPCWLISYRIAGVPKGRKSLASITQETVAKEGELLEM